MYCVFVKQLDGKPEKEKIYQRVSSSHEENGVRV